MAIAGAKQDPVEKGKEGEDAFKKWLDTCERSYVQLCQKPESFAWTFGKEVKRPDFLVLLDSIGMIAVDVKNKAKSGGVFTLDYDEEMRPSIAFERMFRLHLWYAFVGGSGTWHWISALKALEVGENRKANDGKAFVAVPVSAFAKLRDGCDFRKLFDHLQT